MPVVPRQLAPEVQANTGTLPGLSGQTNPQAFGAGLAESLGNLGQTLGSAAQDIHQHALVLQEQDNQAHKDEATIAYEQAKTQMLYLGDDAFYRLEGKDAYEAFPKVQQDLADLRDKMSAGLPNPRVRQLFDNDTRRDAMLTMQNMASHAATQRQSWVKHTAASGLQTQVQVASMAQSPEELDGKLNDIIKFGVSHARDFGWDPETQELKTKEAVGQAVTGYVGRVALNDPVAAQKFLQAHEDLMPPEMYLQAAEHMQSRVDPYIADQAARSHIARASGAMPGDTDSALNYIVDKYENNPTPMKDSNGATVRWGVNQKANPDVDVTNLTRAQAMDIYKERYVKPLAGSNIPVDMQLAAIDSSILAGPAKTVKMLAQADGDAEKFAALRKAALPNDSKRKAGWVKRIDDALQGGAVADATPKEVLGKEADVLQSIDSDPSLTPRQRTQARSAAQAQMRSDYMASQAQLNDNYQTALGVAMGGPQMTNPPGTLNDALKDQNFATAYYALDATHQQAVANEITRANVSRTSMTPELMGQYHAFSIEASQNPNAFMQHDFISMSEAAAKAGHPWPSGMTMKLLNLQTSTLKGQSHPLNPHMDAVMHSIPIKMLLTKSDIVTDDKGNVDKDKYFGFYGQVQAHIEAYESLYKKPPSQDEVLRFAQETVAGGKWRNATFGSVLAGRDAQGKQHGIPDKELPQVIEYLKSRGVHSPTNQQVYAAWQAGQ